MPSCLLSAYRRRAVCPIGSSRPPVELRSYPRVLIPWSCGEQTTLVRATIDRIKASNRNVFGVGCCTECVAILPRQRCLLTTTARVDQRCPGGAAAVGRGVGTTTVGVKLEDGGFARSLATSRDDVTTPRSINGADLPIIVFLVPVLLLLFLLPCVACSSIVRHCFGLDTEQQQQPVNEAPLIDLSVMAPARAAANDLAVIEFGRRNSV